MALGHRLKGHSRPQGNGARVQPAAGHAHHSFPHTVNALHNVWHTQVQPLHEQRQSWFKYIVKPCGQALPSGNLNRVHRFLDASRARLFIGKPSPRSIRLGSCVEENADECSECHRNKCCCGSGILRAHDLEGGLGGRNNLPAQDGRRHPGGTHQCPRQSAGQHPHPIVLRCEPQEYPSRKCQPTEGNCVAQESRRHINQRHVQARLGADQEFRRKGIHDHERHREDPRLPTHADRITQRAPDEPHS